MIHPEIKSIRNIPIEKISFDQGIYPRASTNQEMVAAYADRLESTSPPPVKVAEYGDGRYLLLDGNHRVEACRKAGRKETEAEVIDADTRDIVRMGILAWSYNMDNRGVFITPDEVEKNVCRYFEAGLSIKDLSELSQRTERTIERWTKAIRKKKTEEKEQKVLELRREGKTQEEIEKATGVPQRTVSRIEKRSLAKNDILSETAKTPFITELDSAILSLNREIDSLIPGFKKIMEMIGTLPELMERAKKENEKAISAALSGFALLRKDSRINETLPLFLSSLDMIRSVSEESGLSPEERLEKWYIEIRKHEIFDGSTCKGAIKELVSRLRREKVVNIDDEIRKTYELYLDLDVTLLLNIDEKRILNTDHHRTFTTFARYFDVFRRVRQRKLGFPSLPSRPSPPLRRKQGADAHA